MNCKEYKNLILLESSGELDAELKNQLTCHLEKCDGCREFADELNTLTSAKTLQQPHPSVLANIHNAAEKEQKRHIILFRRPLPALRMAAAIAFLLISGALLFNNSGQRNEQHRIRSVNTMLLLFSDPETETADQEVSNDLESIARQLLDMEGFGDEDGLDEETVISLLGEPDPTTTQSHSTPAPPAERCVQSHQHSPTPSTRHQVYRQHGNSAYLPA